MRTRIVRTTKNTIMNNPVNNRLKRNFIGGLISGIGSMFGASINASSQDAINRENIRAQKEENALNRQFTEDMYNQYESPVAQAQQMREAGLNPNGAISPQSVGSASTSALPVGQAPQWGSAIQSGIDTLWSTLSTVKELRLKDQEIDSKILDNWLKEFENGTADERYRAEMEKYSAESGKTREERRLLRDQRKQLELEYKAAKDAYDKGINSHVDSHNESVARATSTSDSNTRENELHEDNKSLLKHTVSKAFYDSQISRARAAVDLQSIEFDKIARSLSASKLLNEVEQLEYSNNIDEALNEIYTTAIDLFGFDIRILPSELQSRLLGDLQQYRHHLKYGNKDEKEKSLNQMFSTYQQIDDYINKAKHIPRSVSQNFKSGPFGYSYTISG